MAIDFIKTKNVDLENAPFTLYFDSTSLSNAQKALGALIGTWWDFGNVGAFGGSLPGERIPTFDENVAEWRLELDHLIHRSDYSLEKESFLVQTLLCGLENLELTFPYMFPGENLTVNTLVIGIHSTEDLSKTEK